MSEGTENAEVFLQWKGTDACFDFTCACGNSDHIDGDFAYYVQCEACGQVYEMPTQLTATPVDDSRGHVPMTAHREEDGRNASSGYSQDQSLRFKRMEDGSFMVVGRGHPER
jgi:hypothetical protein